MRATPKTKSKLKNLPIEGSSDTLSISILINPHEINAVLPRDQILFCYQALLNTIYNLLSKKYSEFDGHTTSNCCHGMALLAWHLIQMSLELNLHTLRQEYELAVHQLQQHASTKTSLPCVVYAPKELINLACLYILCLTKEPDPQKGGRTKANNLKIIAPISGAACRKISSVMQKVFANWVALSYSSYLEALNDDLYISGGPVNLWGKYIHPKFIRSDKRGVKYASNLFSMQITLAYLSQSRGKVALINDVQNTRLGCVTERYTCLFEGDGQGGFIPLSDKELYHLETSVKEEPVVILGGCIYSDTMTNNSLTLKMQPWLEKLPQLILACDVFYPQFVEIMDDPEFDSTEIIPDELELKELIHCHSQVKGVSIKDPSLYCLSHIYPGSLHQVLDLKIKNKKNELPLSFIPSSLIFFRLLTN